MTPELAKITLEAMGYKKRAPQCRNCLYFEEVENANVDRMWDTVCNFSNLGTIRISPDGCCEKFHQRKLTK